MHKRQLITSKPAYRHGQLLLEDDFIAEQRLHLDALRLHSRMLHGFGIVSGLEVKPSGELGVSVAPGFAIDRQGREIHLREPETLEFQGLPAGAIVVVTLGYRTQATGHDNQPGNRIECFAHLRIATGVEGDDVRLAGVQLDEHGRFARLHTGAESRDPLRGPGAEAPLRHAWISLAFHPSPMPQDEKDARPPFRMGATQALAHKEYDGKPNTRGAAGTMTFLLPPNVQSVRRLRIAGVSTEGKLTATLVKGGFDSRTFEHMRDEIVRMTLDPDKPEKAGDDEEYKLKDNGRSGYSLTKGVPEAHRGLREVDEKNPLQRTLSIDVRSHAYVAISLVAIQVAYAP